MLYCYVILKAHYEVSSTQSMYLLNLTVLVAYTPPTPAQHIRQLSRRRRRPAVCIGHNVHDRFFLVFKLVAHVGRMHMGYMDGISAVSYNS